MIEARLMSYMGCFLCGKPLGLKGTSPALKLFVRNQGEEAKPWLVHRDCSAKLQRRASMAGTLRRTSGA